MRSKSCQRCGGVDHAACSNDEHDLGIAGQLDGPLEDAIGQHLAEPHNAGTGQPTASVALGHGFVHRRHTSFKPALGAAIDPDVAMQAEDLFAAGLLMQTVNVLRDQVKVVKP